MSSLLSKHTGSRPSSKQHLMHARPELPPPIIATRLAMFFFSTCRQKKTYIIRSTKQNASNNVNISSVSAYSLFWHISKCDDSVIVCDREMLGVLGLLSERTDMMNSHKLQLLVAFYSALLCFDSDIVSKLNKPDNLREYVFAWHEYVNIWHGQYN